jgi:transposase IS66-like protein/transposase IS66 family protein
LSRIARVARDALHRLHCHAARRIDALFAIERSINHESPEERLAVRRAVSRPLVDDLMTTMRGAGGQAWLADVLSRIASHLTHRLDELLPWNWRPRLRPSRRSRPDPCT